MSRISDAIEAMQDAIEALKPYEDLEAVPPVPGKLFWTFNGSVVYLTKIDSDGDGIAVVLKGGHGVDRAKGEEPGESYYVDEDGYFKSTEPGRVTLMSLRQMIPFDLPEME
jgi:hypothetical protein